MTDRSVYDNFYILRDVGIRACMICSPIDENDLEYRKYEFMSEDYINVLPTEFRHRRGRRQSAGNGFISGVFIVSEKLKINLEKEAITGIKFIPISVRLKNNEVIHDYYIMAVTGKAQEAKREDSELWYYGNERSCSWNDVGYFFPMESWDGSDVFVVSRKATEICITERAKKVFEKYPFDFECCRTFEWVVGSIRVKKMDDKVPLEKPEEINGFKIESQLIHLFANKLREGDIVEHPAFGEGVVRQIHFKNDRMILVHFEKAYRKHIKLDIALDTSPTGFNGITKISRTGPTDRPNNFIFTLGCTHSQN